MSFAFFFPGQGSQSLGMMNDFKDLKIVRQTFDEASNVLQQDLWSLAEKGPVELLNATENTQPLMLTAGVAVWRAYVELGGQAPAVLAGHSLGEYTALSVAGSLSFHEALKLVKLRANLMQNAVPHNEGAMMAILGLDDNTVRSVCKMAEAEKSGVAEAVNFNSPGQVVIAGSCQTIEHAATLAKHAGAKRAMILPISAPSHCRLMLGAAKELQQELENIEVLPPTIPVIHNVDVAQHQEPAAIREALVKQLYSPVRWSETVLHITQNGIKTAAECAPGKVLTTLAKRIDKDLSCAAFTSEEALKAWLNI